MKVIHVPYTFHPDPAGGTEIYVESLARALSNCGVDSVICAPGARNESHSISDLRVHRFAGHSEPLPLHYSYDEGDELAAKAFDAVLTHERPDVVHLHAFSPVVSLTLAKLIKARRIPIVFTYHTPASTCQRGTLLRWGKSKCGGELNVAKCTACSLHALGLSRPLASLLGLLPPAAGAIIATRHLAGGAWTALRMSRLVAQKHAAVKSFLSHADAIVAPSEWVKSLLIANGVPSLKVLLCRQGIEAQTQPLLVEPPHVDGDPLRVVVLGRLEPAKGLDVLVNMTLNNRDLALRLDIYGESDSHGNDEYSRNLARRVAMDGRIRLLRAIPHDKVLATIARYDVLAAPSQGYETGPLVVLEAFAAGIPVIGSDLGGIAERVVHEKTGLLVPYSSEASWAHAFRRLLGEPNLLPRLRENVLPPADMNGVSEMMKSLYFDISARKRRADRDPAHHPEHLHIPAMVPATAPTP